jgi:F-type H+-transporting ATPase subunit alpha
VPEEPAEGILQVIAGRSPACFVDDDIDEDAFHGLHRSGALAHSVVVVASDEDPPGLRFITPYAATSMAKHFMEQGQDALIVYDDLTRHARAYRELSLLLRRPPGRDAYPGDIFYIHSRLLERATHLNPSRGGGSLTALPIAETEAQDISAFVPTNLRPKGATALQSSAL